MIYNGYQWITCNLKFLTKLEGFRKCQTLTKIFLINKLQLPMKQTFKQKIRQHNKNKSEGGQK